MKNDGTTFVVRRDDSGLWAVTDVKSPPGTVVQGAELVEAQYTVVANTTMFDGRFKMYLNRVEHVYCGGCGGHVKDSRCTVCGDPRQ